MDFTAQSIESEPILEEKTLLEADIKRAKLRCQLNNDELKQMLEAPTTEKHELKELLAKFDDEFARLLDYFNQLERLTPTEKIEEMIKSHEEFIRPLRKMRVKGESQMDKYEAHSDISASSSTQTLVKLPKLELPTYDGDPTAWVSWYDIYKANVHDAPMATINKFSHLKMLLGPKARSCISDLPFTAKNYEAALKQLEDRFGRKVYIKALHVSKLLNNVYSGGTATGRKKIDALYAWMDTLSSNISQLNELSVSDDQMDAFLMPIIVKQMPEPLRLEWSRDSANKEHNTRFFLEWLKTEIERHERSEIFGSVYDVTKPKEKPPHRFNRSNSTTPSTSALSAEVTPKCSNCQGPHYITNCPAYDNLTLQELKSKLAQQDRCYRCTRQGHQRSNCRRRIKCYQCGSQRHSTLLCPNKFSSRTPPPPSMQPETVVATPATVQESVTLLNSTNQGNKPNMCSLLPTALVKVVNNNSEILQLRCLFDTSCNRSFITTRAVEIL